MSSHPSQLKSTILKAGAGAGKTTRLTAEFLKFANDFKAAHGRFPSVVITTFTRKATQELKERLLKKSLEEGREDLFQYVSTKSQVQISTIHGVLSLFLSRYGAAIGLTPDYTVQDDREIRKSSRKIIRKILLEDSRLQELLEEYDFGSLEECLLEFFSESFIHPKMRFMTATEMETAALMRLHQASGKIRKTCLEITSQTNNEKWLQYAQALVGFNWLREDEDWEQFLERLQRFWQEHKKPDYRSNNPPFSGLLNEEFLEARKMIENILEEPRYRRNFWRKHQENCQLFQSLSERFQKEFLKFKLESGAISMSDLELLSYKLILESPESAEHFSKDWNYWMVDEYQDTSPVQVFLLRSLIGQSPSFVVGDPQQSIYLFRGARSEVFQEKVLEVETLGGNSEKKLENYRSTASVLAFLNYYFTNLSNDFTAMVAAGKESEDRSFDQSLQILISEETDSDDLSAETVNVVARVQELLIQGVSPEQICILGRTHRVLEEVASYAQAKGLPVLLHSGSGFFERREIKDALALLKFLLNPHDNLNFVALLRSPWLKVPDRELIQYCHNGNHSFWTEAVKFVDEKEQEHALVILKSILIQCEQMGVTWTFKNSLVRLGLIDYSTRLDSSGRREANIWKLVALLSQEERRPGFNYLEFLDSNLEGLTTEEGGGDADGTPVVEPKRVNFMTVHASKGLQFEHVIVPAMGRAPRASHSPLFCVEEASGKWTLKVRNEETQSLDASLLSQSVLEMLRERESKEFNRVLYVALTRAKKGITLIWDKKIEKKSWAADCPLNLQEGLHHEADFSYLVRHENLKVDEVNFVARESVVPRPRYQSAEKEQKKRTISVTEFVSAGQAFDGVSLPGQIESGIQRAQQGTEAHRIFEALKYSSVDSLLENANEDQKRALRYLSNLDQPPLLRIVEGGQVEWGFAMIHKDVLLQGQVDLWGVNEGTLWVVDYKTGSQKHWESAYKQLELYAWALIKMGVVANINNIQLAVIYPMEEAIKIFKVESLGELVSKIETLVDGYLYQT